MKKSPNPRLLAEEEFIAVQPSLIRAMNGKVLDAILLQYLFWWQRMSLNSHGEHNDWVFNSYEQWADKIGVSVSQVRTSMDRLEGAGFVMSCKPEASHFKQCKWYRVDLSHPVFSELPEMTDPSVSSGKPFVSSSKSSSYTERTQRATGQTGDRVTEVTANPPSSLPAGTERAGGENLNESPSNSPLDLGTKPNPPKGPATPPAPGPVQDTTSDDGTMAQGNSTRRQRAIRLDGKADVSKDSTGEGAKGPDQGAAILDKVDGKAVTPARVIFDEWVKVMERDPKRTKLTNERRTKINARLRGGMTAEEVVQAIKGARTNPWMMGQNDRNTVYDDITTILGNDSKAEKHLESYRRQVWKKSDLPVKGIGQGGGRPKADQGQSILNKMRADLDAQDVA